MVVEKTVRIAERFLTITIIPDQQRDKIMISFNGGQIKAGQTGLISLLTGLHIKMEGHHLLERRVDQSIRFYGVDGFGVFFTSIAGIDAIFLFLFTEKITHRLLVGLITIGA